MSNARLSHSPSPWTTKEHDGLRWMVRDGGSDWWFVRLPDRATFLLDAANVPAWARGSATESQMGLFA